MESQVHYPVPPTMTFAGVIGSDLEGALSKFSSDFKESHSIYSLFYETPRGNCMILAYRSFRNINREFLFTFTSDSEEVNRGVAKEFQNKLGIKLGSI